MLHALMLYHSTKNIHKKYFFFHITIHFLYFSIGNSQGKRQGSERKEKKTKKHIHSSVYCQHLNYTYK